VKEKNQQKKNIAVLFGGASPEHDISVKSALFVLKSLSIAGFNSRAYYLDRLNRPGSPEDVIKRVEVLINEGILSKGQYVEILNSGLIQNKVRDVSEMFSVLQSDKIDVVFPVFHGPGGEDGSIQGALEFFKIPYVGCGVAGSAMAMDKVITKTMCLYHGIPVVDYISFTVYEWKNAVDSYLEKIEERIGYPCFIKPARQGSSIGISRADNKEELVSSIKKASDYDSKVLCEPAISGREYSVGVIGTSRPEASVPAEISLWNDFFDYPAKYGPDAVDDIIPAPVGEELTRELQRIALKTYKILGLSGMARIDSFIEKGRVLVNEVNTIPGMGGNSLFHRMWEKTGVSPPDLFTKLIQFAVE
jgi:D-alanine-D-alanine ligase